MRAFTAQHFLPRKRHDIEFVPRQVHRKGCRGGIANCQAGARCRYRIAIGQTHARGGAIPRKHHILVKIDLGQIDNLAIRCLAHGGIEFQLFDGIRHPAFAKAFPCQHFHRTRPQKRPHRHFNSACVRAGNDAYTVAFGKVQNFGGQVNRLCELGFSDSGTMRAAQRRVTKHVEGIIGDFGAGARRESRIRRPKGRGRNCHCSILTDICPSLGRGVPLPDLRLCSGWCKRENYRKAPHQPK